MFQSGKKFLESGNYDKAIQTFCMMLGQDRNNLITRQYLAISYYYSEDKYDLAEEQFKILEDCNDEEFSNYGASMIATIEGINRGNYDYAIAKMKKVRLKINSTINFAIIYNLKFRATKDKKMLGEAQRLLESLKISETLKKFHWRIYLTLGNTYQYYCDFQNTKKYYEKALNSTDSDLTKAKILNEYANLYRDMKQPDRAVKVLDQVLQLIGPENERTRAYNAKYRAVIEKDRGNYEIAQGLLLKASNIYEDKELLGELAEVNMLLFMLHNPEKKTRQIAEVYAESTFTEKEKRR